jgi:hypothetical protein
VRNTHLRAVKVWRRLTGARLEDAGGTSRCPSSCRCGASWLAVRALLDERRRPDRAPLRVCPRRDYCMRHSRSPWPRSKAHSGTKISIEGVRRAIQAIHDRSRQPGSGGKAHEDAPIRNDSLRHTIRPAGGKLTVRDVPPSQDEGRDLRQRGSLSGGDGRVKQRKARTRPPKASMLLLSSDWK